MSSFLAPVAIWNKNASIISTYANNKSDFKENQIKF